MPLISRLFVKAGMIYFILALLAGLLLELSVPIPALMPLFWHTLMLGWITQIIMGVSIWMFPGRNRSEDFWSQKWNWATLFLLNTGLLFRVVAEPAVSLHAAAGWKLLLVASALLQLLAGAAYLAEMWPRILSKKKQRERRRKMRGKS